MTVSKFAQKMVNDLQQKAVCLSVEMGVFSIKRKVDSGKITTDADKKMVHIQKSIIDCDEWKDIARLDAMTRQFLYSRCLPMGKRGIYLHPVKILDSTMEYLKKYQEDRKELVARFIKVYPDEVKTAKKLLGSLASEFDYPSVGEVERKFWVSVSMFELGAPNVLKTVNSEAYNESLKQLSDLWQEARNEIVGTLYEELNGLTEHLIERLSPSPNGEKRIFRDSAIENLNEWLGLFDARNLTDDAALKAVVDKLRGTINGVDAGQLRDSERLRSSVAAGFAAAKRELDIQIQSIERRRFRLE